MTRDKFLNKITKIKKTLCKDTSMEREEILNKIDKLNKALEYAEESLEMGKTLGCGEGMLYIFEMRIPDLQREIKILEDKLEQIIK